MSPGGALHRLLHLSLLSEGYNELGTLAPCRIFMVLYACGGLSYQRVIQ
jgi:hypothetical protein